MNVIDRIAGWWDPANGLRRHVQRQALAAVMHPYEAATPSRLRKHYRNRESPNQLTQRGAVAIRDQVRQLERNHDITRGALRTMVNNIVGGAGIGIEPQPRRADGSIHDEYAAALRDLYREFCLRPEVTGRHHMAKAQRLLAKTWLRDGEAFAQQVIGPQVGITYPTRLPLALELFEPDLVPYEYNEGSKIRQGIEVNAWGRPVAYWLYKGHPADMPGLPSAASLKRVSADRIMHIAAIDRIGQIRGVSEFASVITRIEDVKDYEESERIAAKVAAALTVAIKREAPQGEGYTAPLVDAEGKPVPRSLSMAPGMIIDSLAPGESIEMIDSKRPNPALIGFRQGQLQALACGIGASYSSIARDYSGTYSSQRQELVEQWVNYATLTDEFTGQFVQPLWSTIVSIADISGAVPMPRDVVPSTADDALFIGQSMPWIDPLKEAEAWVYLVRAGFASEVEVIRRRGGNARDLLQQIRSYRKDADGLVLTSNGANPINGASSKDQTQGQQQDQKQ